LPVELVVQLVVVPLVAVVVVLVDIDVASLEKTAVADLLLKPH
jgi:hypothetical protein